MYSRGQPSNLLSGFFYAVPSGIAVALCCVEGGVNALVGAAIAASLLPPICNLGLCLGFGLAGATKDPDNAAFYHDQTWYYRNAGAWRQA